MSNSVNPVSSNQRAINTYQQWYPGNNYYYPWTHASDHTLALIKKALKSNKSAKEKLELIEFIAS